MIQWMVPEFVILSRTNAENYEPTGAEVCISIGNPKTAPVKLSSGFRDVLHLTFTDIASPSPMRYDLLFAPEHARAILEFIARWPDVERIVVHCVAGQSRSPAVAMGICELRGWPTETLEMLYPSWNKWVRSELVREGRECQRRSKI
jgi:predicted protein tyrosine phosphatase